MASSELVRAAQDWSKSTSTCPFCEEEIGPEGAGAAEIRAALLRYHASLLHGPALVALLRSRIQPADKVTNPPLQPPLQH